MFPDINTKDIKPWAGLRPMTLNMLPIFKRSSQKKYGLYWYGHLGWTLSAYTANSIVNSFIIE